MIHDVLLGMLGFTGDIVEFVDNRLVLQRAVQLERFDRDIVEGLLDLGSMYVMARDWAETARRSPVSNVYELAVAKALEEGLLAEYESSIAEFEEKILQLDGKMTLCTLRLELWETYWPSFEVITMQLLQWTGDNWIDHALGLSSRVRDNHLLGVTRALVCCLVKELTSWCKYAVVAGGERSRFLVRETPSGAALIDQIGRFQIDKERIPNRLVTAEVCNKILFCGRTVIVLQNGDPTTLVAADFPLFKTPVPEDLHVLPEFISKEIEGLRLHLSGKLGHRMKVQMTPTLLEHVDRLRGLFLLGYGQKWVTLIEEVGGDVPAKLAQRFTTVFADCPCVSLTATRELLYELPWPAELVVSPSALVKYREIFDVLFRVMSASVRTRYAYNMQLSNLLGGITSYFQLDLIETAFKDLLEVVNSKEDIQEIAMAHEVFLNRVHSGCLVGLESVWNVINRIIALGEELARDRHTAGEAMDARIAIEVKALVKELEALQTRTTYASVNRLVLKLDFNNFYRGNSFVTRDS